MVKLPPSHTLLIPHSVSDWDFEDNDWELSNTRFVTPPTSLHRTANGRCAVLCRLADTLVLPQGRLITHAWVDQWFHSIFIFRAQTALGAANHLNNYSIRTASTLAIVLWVTVAGVETVIGLWYGARIPNVWNKYRLTWWNGYDLHDTPSLLVKLERYESGSWVSKGILYDPNNRWVDSAQNRCGIELRVIDTFIDDTEIWKSI